MDEGVTKSRGPLIRVEIDTGEVIELVPDHASPLSYEELSPNRPSPHSYSIELAASEVGLTINGETTTRGGTVRATAYFHEPVVVFGLIEGGWLPPPFVPRPHFLADRNVIFALKRLSEQARDAPEGARNLWLSMLKSEHVVISPLLFALEGRYQRQPTQGEIKEAYQEGLRVIQGALPDVRVPAMEEENFRGVFGLVEEIEARSQREAKFLCEIGPLVVDRPALKAAAGTTEAVIQAARKHHLRPLSLAVLSALACIWETEDEQSPARGVIKPSRSYDLQAAYNALADFRHIEWTLVARTLHEDNFVLCTCDRPLARLWTALNPMIRIEETGVSRIQLTLTKHLLPRLEEVERINLTQRLWGLSQK